MRDRPAFIHSGRALAGVLLVALALAGSGAACSLILDADANPQRCSKEADCARFPDAVCDNARRVCVPRLPRVMMDAGSQNDAVADGGGGLTCELSFDNQARIALPGPDGGLRPLPEGP
jgi:hypothetical protein